MIRRPPRSTPFPYPTLFPSNDTFADVTGTLSTTDRDTGDTASYSITGGSTYKEHTGFLQSLTPTYCTLYLNSSTGAYSFVANASAINELHAGSNPAVVFTLN